MLPVTRSCHEKLALAYYRDRCKRIYVKKKKKTKKWSSPLDTTRLGENTKGEMAPTKPTTAKRNL